MKNTHFILIKHPSETHDGMLRSATESCQSLLSWGLWPLFENTRCRLMIKAGNQVLIYTAGQGKDARRILATAKVADIVKWSPKIERACPLFLDGIPVSALVLEHIAYLGSPVNIKDHLDDLSFIPENREKWGVAMMGGMRSIPENDFKTLSSQKGATA